jgi:hypothetical protein
VTAQASGDGLGFDRVAAGADSVEEVQEKYA